MRIKVVMGSNGVLKRVIDVDTGTDIEHVVGVQVTTQPVPPRRTLAVYFDEWELELEMDDRDDTYQREPLWEE